MTGLEITLGIVLAIVIIALFIVYKAASSLENELLEVYDTLDETLDDVEESIEIYNNKPYREINLHAQCEHCLHPQIIQLNKDMFFTCEKCNKDNSIILEVKSFAITAPLTSTTGFTIDNN